MKKYILFTLIVLLLISCNSSKSSLSTIVIDLDNVEDIKLSDIVDSIKMVQLETTPECLMQHVSKTFIYNDRFYVFDSKQYVVFCFDKSGKFLFKIDNRGRGPQEYSNICDVELDKINNRLLLLEPWGNIYYFTLEGEFISKLKLSSEILAYNFIYSVDKDSLLFYSMSDNLVSYSQQENKVIYKEVCKYNVNRYTMFDPRIYIYNNSINIVDCITLSTYKFSFLGHHTAVHLADAGKYNIDESKVKEYEDYAEKNGIENGNIPKYLLSSAKESDRYIFYYFYNTEEKEFNIALFDKKTDIIKVTKQVIDNVFFISVNKNIEHNIYIMSDTKPFIVKNDKSNYYNPDLLDAKNKAIVEAHTDDMNPMLALYYLKK